jgi:hypothetical protein
MGVDGLQSRSTVFQPCSEGPLDKGSMFVACDATPLWQIVPTDGLMGTQPTLMVRIIVIMVIVMESITQA